MHSSHLDPQTRTEGMNVFSIIVSTSKQRLDELRLEEERINEDRLYPAREEFIKCVGEVRDTCQRLIPDD